MFDELLQIDSSDLTLDEVDELRPAFYRRLAATASEPLYVKAHDANGTTRRGEHIFPSDITDRALYVIRDPRDVAVSLAHHEGSAVADAVTALGDPDAAINAGLDGLPAQLRQHCGSWSEHATSWVDAARFPTHVVRYEDMVATPHAAFGAALEFLGLPPNHERLEHAIAASTFAELRHQELASGFRESAAASAFFRRGVTDAWRDEMTPHDAVRVVATHRDVMTRFGYLSAEGTSGAVSVSRLRP